MDTQRFRFKAKKKYEEYFKSIKSTYIDSIVEPALSSNRVVQFSRVISGLLYDWFANKSVPGLRMRPKRGVINMATRCLLEHVRGM